MKQPPRTLAISVAALFVVGTVRARYNAHVNGGEARRLSLELHEVARTWPD